MDLNIKSNQIQRISISEQIFSILREKITSGEWKPGFKMPSENELASLFNVSRMSVRSALQRLLALGFITTVVGEGTFVKEFSPGDFFSGATKLLASSASKKEITEFRFSLESECIRLAIEKATDRDIEELREICDRFSDAAVQDDLNEYMKQDMLFHLQICKMTKNSIFLTIYEAFKEIMYMHYLDNIEKFMIIDSGSEKKGGDIKASLNKIARIHSKYVDSIANRDYGAYLKCSQRWAIKYAQFDS